MGTVGDTRLRVMISGRVQGVWFRAWTQQEAERLGLSGWVRNLADGRVEATFAGPSAQVEEMLRLCGQGPPLARVESVEVDNHHGPLESGFHLRPTV